MSRHGRSEFGLDGPAPQIGPLQSNKNDTIDAPGTTSAGSGPKLDPIDQLASDAETDLDQTFPGLAEQVGAIQDTKNRIGEGDAVAASEQRAAQGSATDAATLERQTRGLDLSARQLKAQKSRIGLSRSISRASAAGETRRGFADRAKGVNRVSGAFSDQFFGSRMGVGVDSANIFGIKKAQTAREQANKAAARTSMWGTIIGIGLSLWSSEAMKDDKGTEKNLLSKLKKVRVNRWNYKGDTAQHVGPFAEEFNREFGIKTDHPDVISVIDALGVNMGAIKELNEKVERLGG